MKNTKQITKKIFDNLDDIKHLLIPKTDDEKAFDKLKKALQEAMETMGDDEQNNFDNKQEKKQEQEAQEMGGVGGNSDKDNNKQGNKQGVGEEENTQNTQNTIQINGNTLKSVRGGGKKERESSKKPVISTDELTTFINQNIHKLMRSISIFKDITTKRTLTNLKRGSLDTQKLYKINNSNRLFKKNVGIDKDYTDTVVYILCDESGSMEGKKSILTSKATALFMKGLEKVGIKCALYGFNCYYNKHKGVDSTFNVSQCQDIDKHTIYDNFGGTENGYFLQKTYNELKKRPETNKILVSFTDGQSADSNDVYEVDNINYSDYPLKNVVKNIEADRNIKLLSFGICDDSVRSIYKQSKVLQKPEELVPELVTLFKQLMPSNR
jgi:hypothetical protein